MVRKPTGHCLHPDPPAPKGAVVKPWCIMLMLNVGPESEQGASKKQGIDGQRSNWTSGPSCNQKRIPTRHDFHIQCSMFLRVGMEKTAQGHILLTSGHFVMSSKFVIVRMLQRSLGCHPLGRFIVQHFLQSPKAKEFRRTSKITKVTVGKPSAEYHKKADGPHRWRPSNRCVKGLAHRTGRRTGPAIETNRGKKPHKLDS